MTGFVSVRGGVNSIPVGRNRAAEATRYLEGLEASFEGAVEVVKMVCYVI